MAGALSKDAIIECGVRWKRRRPWLNDEEDPQDCNDGRTRLYVLQRGASNVYFSVVRSALSISPWSDPLQAEVSYWWGQFKSPLPPEAWSAVIQARFPGEDENRVRECIARLAGLKSERPAIRREEYEVFLAGQETRSPFFEARATEVSALTGTFLNRLVAVSRLREVRALVGFKRIEAPETDPTIEVFNQEHGIAVTTAPLSVRQLDWLPAVENLGEGVFLELNRERLQAWEDLDFVQRRTGVLLKAYSDWRQARGFLCFDQ